MNCFRYYLRVRHGECDVNNAVHTSTYGGYSVLATGELLRLLGLHKDKCGDGVMRWQPVKQTIEWKSPARFDEILEVSVYVVGVDASSFTTAAEIRVVGADTLCATAETRHAIETVLSDRQREVLLHGAKGMVVDHAAYLADQYCAVCMTDLPLCM